jgi:spore coat polysaccharide biosynthesis predicted glycosyltransferase SpsG
MAARVINRRPRPRCHFQLAAGPRVGFGHLMRARALAGCLDMDVTVSVRGGRAARVAASAIGAVVDARAALRDRDLLIVDDPSRMHGRAWIARARRRGIRSVSVHDDVWAHDADLVVTAGLGIGTPRTTAPAVLHGARFYLLDTRIVRARRQRPPRRLARPRVLVALGGGHHVRAIAQNLTDAILRACPRALVLVAAGFASGRRPALRQARWLSARQGLIRALATTDVAIVAGGVTLYEACALGVPSVALSVVPAQQPAIRAFAKARAVINAGDVSSDGAAIERAARSIAQLVRSAPLRAATASRARRLVDGRGATRVAARIELLLKGARRDV